MPGVKWVASSCSLSPLPNPLTLPVLRLCHTYTQAQAPKPIATFWEWSFYHWTGLPEPVRAQPIGNLGHHPHIQPQGVIFTGWVGLVEGPLLLCTAQDLRAQTQAVLEQPVPGRERRWGGGWSNSEGLPEKDWRPCALKNVGGLMGKKAS